MKHLRYYLYFCILCISVMSCASTPATGALYFPITVLAGVADLTVSTAGEIQVDASDKTEAFTRNARMLNKDLNLRPNTIIFQTFSYNRGGTVRKR